VVAKTGDIIGGKTLTGFKQPSFGANSPAINAGGSVAFYATYSEGAFVGEGIFTPASLVLKNGDSVSGHTLDGISFVPALNDSGTVVVRGFLSSQGSAILTSTALLAEAGDKIGGQTLTDIGLPAINNNGTVVFVGSSSTGTGVFTQTAVLAKSGESIEGQKLTSFSPPAINDRGMVAFQSWLSGKIARRRWALRYRSPLSRSPTMQLLWFPFPATPTNRSSPAPHPGTRQGLVVSESRHVPLLLKRDPGPTGSPKH
jgi:hypothetical protein